jgi:hypothetical protein
MPNRHGGIRDTAGKRHQDGRQLRQPRVAFQTLLGLGSARAPVRRATIRKAADLPYYYEGEDAREAEAEEALA